MRPLYYRGAWGIAVRLRDQGAAGPPARLPRSSTCAASPSSSPSGSSWARTRFWRPSAGARGRLARPGTPIATASRSTATGPSPGPAVETAVKADDPLERIDEAFQRAVDRARRRARDLGISLSGGLDARTILRPDRPRTQCRSPPSAWASRAASTTAPPSRWPRWSAAGTTATCSTTGS